MIPHTKEVLGSAGQCNIPSYFRTEVCKYETPEPNELGPKIYDLAEVEGCNSMVQIAKEIAKPPATILSYLWYHGDIEPRDHARSKTALFFCERESIPRGLASGQGIRAMAAILERIPSKVFSEVRRSGGARRYRTVYADKAAWKHAERPKLPLLATNLELRRVVTSKLTEDWSPEQISGWLKIQFPDDERL